MSAIPTSAEDLREIVRALRGRLDDVEARMEAASTMRQSMQDDLRDLEADNEALRERIGELESEIAAIRSIGSEKTNKEEKFAQIVSYAVNEASPDRTAVTVTIKNIKGATGVSRRYAYTLAEELADEYDWAIDPTARDRPVDQDTPNKGVTIDLERLHTDPESVNKFTTRTGQNGGA